MSKAQKFTNFVVWLAAAAGVLLELMTTGVRRKVGLMFGELWHTANVWLRSAIAFVVVWPIVLALVALADVKPLSALVGWLPFLALVCVLVFNVFPPAVFGAATLIERLAGRIPVIGPNIGSVVKETVGSALRGFYTLLAAELLAGIYFTFVPVGNAPEMVPVIFLVFTAIVFVYLGAQNLLTPYLFTGLVMLFIGITVSFFCV